MFQLPARSAIRFIGTFGASAALLLALAGCSTGRGSGNSGGKSVREHALRQLIPYTLKVRRPVSPGADPKAGPGGIDYRSDPLPDQNFDCQDVSWLFKEVDLSEARACLAAMSAPPLPDSPQAVTQLLFNVRWLPVPELDLDLSIFDDESEGGCLKKIFGHLPVPREIFFQSNEGDRLACYSSRIAVESNEVGGFKLPINKTALRIPLPLKPFPKNDAEMRMLLMTWALTPFWHREKNTIGAHLVPDAICRRCLGEKTMLGPTDPAPVSWPQDFERPMNEPVPAGLLPPAIKSPPAPPPKK